MTIKIFEKWGNAPIGIPQNQNGVVSYLMDSQWEAIIADKFNQLKESLVKVCS